MVTVTKDEREWNVVVYLKNDKCPHLIYPNNIHACGYVGKTVHEEYLECTLENCPLRFART